MGNGKDLVVLFQPFHISRRPIDDKIWATTKLTLAKGDLINGEGRYGEWKFSKYD